MKEELKQKEIYNSDIKFQYINEKNKSEPIAYLMRLFNKSMTYETQLDKDISNFNHDEILNFYKGMNSSSINTLIAFNSYLSAYTIWAINKKYVKDNQNHFLEININEMKDSLNQENFEQKYVTKDQIYNWCFNLQNSRDRFIILSLFEGLKGKDYCEITSLKKSDIDFNEKTAQLCTGRQVKISDYFIDVANDAIKSDNYYFVNADSKKGNSIPLHDFGYIIKYYPNIKISEPEREPSVFRRGKTLYTSLVRALRSIDVSKVVSANSIRTSGIIHLVKKNAKELNMTIDDYVFSEHMKDVVEQFDIRNFRGGYFLQKYEDWLKD